MGEVGYILLILGVFSILLYGLHRIILFRRSKVNQENWDIIVEPKKIKDLVDLSLVLRARYEIEVLASGYEEIYHCYPLGLNEDGEIELGLPEHKDAALDFVDKPIQGSFRLSQKDVQEAYNFQTRSKFFGSTKITGSLEKSIRMVIPEMLTRGERRRYVRIEPINEYSFEVDILRSVKTGNPVPLNSFKRIQKLHVRDISLGGMKIYEEKGGANWPVKKDEEIFLHFKLPVGNLNLNGNHNKFFVKAKIIEIDKLKNGLKIVRVMFEARARLNAKDRMLHFQATNRLTFQDLASWIHAYQRYFIQMRRGTAQRPITQKSAAKPKPLVAEPKYPSHKMVRNQTAPSPEH